MGPTLHYELRREDLEAFFRHHATHAPYIVTRNRRWRWVWTVLLGLLGLVYWRLTPVGGFLFLALAVLAFLFYARLNAWWYVRHNRRVNLGADGPRLGAVQLELAGGRLRAEFPEGASELDLSAIRRIDESVSHYFIYLGPVTAAIVPKSPEAEAFLEAVRAASAAA